MTVQTWKGRIKKAVTKYGPPMARYAQRQAYNYIKAKSNTKTRRSGARDYGGTTTQHDQKTIYRAKKMPYRKKKKWRTFVKKVKAVEISDRAKQTVLINSFNFVDAVPSSQAWMETHLYPVNGNIAGTRDMDIIQEDVNTYIKFNINGPVSTGVGQEAIDFAKGNREDTRKELLMASATLDVTYTNTGPAGIELDLYSIVYPRQAQGTNGSFIAAISDNTIYVPPISVVAGGSVTQATGVTLNSRGATLFDIPYGMSRTGAKIVKKEKYFISPGNSITKNIRDPRNHNFRRTTPDTVYQYKNLTQSLIVCVKSIETSVDAQLSQKSTRSYKYTYEGQATPYNRYVQE